MSTVVEPTVESQPEEARPVMSFTRVIESVPGSGSFSGWGPNVTGSSSIVRWN